MIAHRPPSRSHRLASLALVATFGLLVGCGTARVYRSYHGNAFDRAASLAGSTVPGPVTAAVLARHEIGTSPTGRVWPGHAADRLEESGASRTDPDGLLALADLRTKQARRAELGAPREAPGLYLDAVEAASGYLEILPPQAEEFAGCDPREVEARRVYNAAAAGFLRASAGTWMSLDQDWIDGLAARGIEAHLLRDPAVWDAERFDHFYFASDYRVYGIDNPKHADGLGVPLIAENRPVPFSKDEPIVGEERFYPRKLQAYPATALVRVGRKPDGEGRVATVEMHDPMRTRAVAFPVATRPLANDLTTPLAFYFTRLPLPQITQIGLLRPGILEKQTGLYLLHPYEPGKIPVILIHGIWSSPDTWHQALNELRGDPNLRDRYQFWVFFYPSGDPFLYSAAKLRASLGEIRDTLDPTRSDPAFDQMVLVGHSMGGLLSRLMVEDSGTSFWDAIANRPFDELRAGPAQRAMISRVFFFAADPSIRRVIFIATPHRGSTLSGELIGRLGNALIHLPSKFEEIQRSLRDQNPPDFFKAGPLGTQVTSIMQLSTKSPVIAAMNEQPIAPDVVYHSIIAQTNPGPVQDGTDLIVNYKSAHLDGARSELIVEDTHTCLDNPATIAEIRSILYLHLQELAALRPAKPVPVQSAGPIR